MNPVHILSLTHIHIHTHTVSLRSFLILSSHLRLGLANIFFPSCFPTISFMHFSCEPCLLPLDQHQVRQIMEHFTAGVQSPTGVGASGPTLGPSSLLSSGCCEYSDRSVKLTTLLQLVLRLRLHRAVPPFPICLHGVVLN